MAHFTKLLALFLFAVIASTASAQVPGCTADGPDVACILQGAVRGVVEGEMLAFKGIPYARPCRAVALEADGGCRRLVRRARRQSLWRDLSADHRAGDQGRRGLPDSQCLAPAGEAGAGAASHGMADWRRQPFVVGAGIGRLRRSHL